MKYAVIYEDSVWVPGDERSRTNPGHGYPEGYHSYNTIQEFNSEEELIKWIRNNSLGIGKKKYRAIRLFELVVEETVTFKVKPAT